MIRRNCVVIPCAALASVSVAQPLIFDDLPDFKQVREKYAALGVHFAPGDAGVIPGLSEGDPDGWGLEGTNGSAFDGFNGDPSYDLDITFDFPVLNFVMDVARANGSQAGDGLKLQVWLDGEVILSSEFGFGPINLWTGLELIGPLDRITVQGFGAGDHPYGVDNIRFNRQSECAADCDGDESLTLFDFLCFTNHFNIEGDYADCDANGDFDLFDFLCFVNAFNQGC